MAPPPPLLRLAAALCCLSSASSLRPLGVSSGIADSSTSGLHGGPFAPARRRTRICYDFDREGEEELDSVLKLGEQAAGEGADTGGDADGAVALAPPPAAAAAPAAAPTPAPPRPRGGGGGSIEDCPTTLHEHEVVWHDLPIKPGLLVRPGAIRDQEAVLQECEAKGNDPFGTRIWPSGLAAAIDLCDVANVLRDGALAGLEVIELGAGCAVPSFTAAALGASVTATDLAPLTCELLEVAAGQQTYEDNGGTFATTELDVCDDDTALPRCDILVCCDMLYHGWMAEAVARRCIEAYERDNAGLIITSPPGRIGEGRFLSLLDKAGVPHSGFEDAILPAWADKLWPNGADESVTGILRVLPPSLNLGVDQEEILYHGRAPLYKSTRRKKRH